MNIQQTIRRTILDMLNDVGYKIPDDIKEYEKTEKYMTHKKKDENDKIYIFFPVGQKVGVPFIRIYINDMIQNNVSKAIIIAKDSITPFGQQEIDKYKNLNIATFRESDLLINKTKHVLVPKHEIINEEEKKELLKIYGIKENQLPKILVNDPISRHYDAKKGDIFKITRISETGGEYISYRVVI